MKRLKNILIAAWPLLAAGLVFAAFYTSVRSGLWNSRILALALSRVNSVLAGKVKVAALSGDPLSRFALHQVEVDDAHGRPVLTADQAQVRWLWWRVLLFEPGFAVTLENPRLVATKSGDQWNYRSVFKVGPSKKRRETLPRLAGEIILHHAELSLSPAPDRLYLVSIPQGRAQFQTSRGQVKFQVADLQAALSPELVAVSYLSAQGRAAPATQGWEVRLNSGELLAATSYAQLKSAHYATAASQFQAEFAWLELWPEALSPWWPSSPLALAVAGSGSIQGTWQDLSFQARLQSPAGKAQAQGSYRPRQKLLKLEGTMERLSPAELLTRDFPVSRLTGEARLTYQAESAPAGPSAARSLQLSSRLDSFSYPGIQSLPVTVGLTLSGDTYTATTASQVTGAGHELQLFGRLTEPYPLILHASFRDLNPARFRASLPAGSLTGEWRLSGQGNSLDKFSGSGALKLDSARIKELAAENAVLDYHVAAGRITMDRGQASLQGFRVSGQGWLEPNHPKAPYAFDLQAQLQEPRAIAHWSQGRLNFQRGSLSLKLRGDQQTWQASGSGEASDLFGPSFTAASAELTAELSSSSSQQLSGKIQLAAKSAGIPHAPEAKFQVPPLDLSLSAELFPSALPTPRVQFQLQGAAQEPGFGLDAAGELRADRRASAWELKLSSLGLSLYGQKWTLARPAQLDARGSNIRVQELELAQGNEKVRLDGRVWGDRLNLRLGLEQVKIEPWSQEFLPGDTIAGVLSGNLTVQGPPRAPEIQAEWKVGQPRFRRAALDEVEGSARYRSPRLEFASRGVSQTTGEITAVGTLAVDLAFAPGLSARWLEEGMDVEITGEQIAASAFLGLFSGVQEASGLVALKLRLQGSPPQVRLSGQGELKQVGLALPALGIRLHDLSGRAEVQDNLVKIPGLKAFSDENQATLSGQVQLQGFSVSQMDLVLTSQRFQAINTPDIQATVDADLRLTGDPAAPRLSGRLDFIELRYRPPLLLSYQGIAWETEDPTIVVKGEERRAKAEPSWLDRMVMDLKVHIPDTAQLRSSELNLRFGGDLTVEKPPGQLFILSGRVESKEGWVYFQGKPFRLEHGIFVFPGIPVIDPDLDILASYRVNEWTTYVRLFGTLSNPTLEIYSEPPLEPADVLAVILFGRPVNALTEGQKQSLGQTGGQVAARYAATGLAKSLANALNLDVLIVQPGQTPETSTFGVGKYLNERLYLFYSRRFGEQTAEEFRVRYDLSKRLSLEASQNASGEGGADLYYSFPY